MTKRPKSLQKNLRLVTSISRIDTSDSQVVADNPTVPTESLNLRWIIKADGTYADYVRQIHDPSLPELTTRPTQNFQSHYIDPFRTSEFSVGHEPYNTLLATPTKSARYIYN